MKVLVVEDDLTYLRILEDGLRRIPGVTVTLAKSRDSARAALEASDFDLVICDLKIPTGDGQLDLETEHGEAVMALSGARHPGTPIIILSAFGTMAFAVDAVSRAPRIDVIGDGHEDVMVGYRTKDQIDLFMDEVQRFAARLAKTDGIEIRRAAGINLSWPQGRLIRIFAREREGSIVQVSAVTGGFSSTAVFKVRVNGANGQLRGLALAKIGPLEIVKDEANRFGRNISLTLPLGTFANLQRHLSGGAGATGALFYQLAQDAPSLFEVLAEDPSKAAAIVPVLATNIGGWLDGAPQGEVLLGDLRQVSGPSNLDAVVQHLSGIDCPTIEGRRIVARRAVQHGDLHAGNALVFAGDRPVLIDFARAGEFIAGYDPVSLELGLLFHPSGKPIRGNWPAIEQAEQWDDLESYVKDCPCPDFIRACRRWALEASPSDRAVLGCVYLHAVRQLQYDDTDKDIARALIRCAANGLV
jgi:CheY-like chemotaxis protein